MSLMLTTKQKPTVDTQKIEGNQSIPLWKINSQKKAEREEEEDKGKTKQSENNKMALVTSHLSIITVNINGFNIPIKR